MLTCLFHLCTCIPNARAPYAAKGFDLNQQDYYGALTAMDAQIGRLRAMLRARDIADNTVLFFTSGKAIQG
jgi:arylsulfatase A-like enzyme